MHKYMPGSNFLPASAYHSFADLQAFILGNNCFDILIQTALRGVRVFAEYVLDLYPTTLEFLLDNKLFGEATSETIDLPYNNDIDLLSSCHF